MGSNPTSCTLSEDVRAVKERDSSSRGASLVGSIPTLRIRASPRPLQVGPTQKGNCESNTHLTALAQLAEREAFNLTVAGSSPARGETALTQLVECLALKRSKCCYATKPECRGFNPHKR